MKYNRIIVFCDYGLDDAIATLHIIRNASMFEKIDIVPVGGNVSVQTSFRNAHTLLAAISPIKANIRIVDTRDIAQPAADIPEVHGSDGIGDILSQAVSAVPVIDFQAFRAELERQKDPARDCVLSLGPCTIPDMLGYKPFCTILMGGTNREEPNYGAYEFNEGMDVAAFARFAYSATAVATLDTCHDKKFDFTNYVADEPIADSLVKKYIEMCRTRKAIITIYDLVAAFAVTSPEIFDAVRVRRADGVEFNELMLK